jgi:hypothetical protein
MTALPPAAEPARGRPATIADIAAFVGPARAQAALAAGVGVA